MKILNIPEQHDLDIGPYGPACEGFIDAVKNFFTSGGEKLTLAELKKSESYRPNTKVIRKFLDRDLKYSYERPEWVKKNLPIGMVMVNVKPLALANTHGKELTSPGELLNVAKGMVAVLKEILVREKPFIDLRRKLIAEIEQKKDNALADKLWEDHKDQLTTNAGQRFYQKTKKDIPSFGVFAKETGEWPVYLKYKGQHGFNTRNNYKTSGNFEGPSQASAHEYANCLRELVGLLTEVSSIERESFILDADDDLPVDYNELKYGDDITDGIYTGQQITELCHLASDAEYTLSHIVVGLYIAMFDKYMPVPANEGLVGDTINFLFKKKKDKSATNSQEGAEKTVKQLDAAAKKVHEFHKQPEAFKLTGRAVPVGAHLHLAINGKSPVVHSLPHALDKTFKSALELSKKFKKDMSDHARIAKPLIDKFEKDMLAVMERDGSVPQETLDQAMLPIIAAKASLEKTYFNSFGKDQHVAADWVGGNPFFMKEYRRADGTTGWMDESYSVNNPCVAVDKADKIETLMAMAKEVLKFTEEDGWWLKLNGPFDTDANSVKFINYEFDRPVRHLHDMMSEEQVAAIYTLYSFEQNTQSLFFTLCSHVTKMHESVLMYIDWSLEQI